MQRRLVAVLGGRDEDPASVAERCSRAGSRTGKSIAAGGLEDAAAALVTCVYVDLAVRRHQISVDSGATPDDSRASNPALRIVGHLTSFTDRLLAENIAFDEMPPVRYFAAR